MVKFSESIPGTGVNLAKKIRVLTKKIMDLESDRATQPDDSFSEMLECHAYHNAINKKLTNLLKSRKDMIESLIGFYALDNFTQYFKESATKFEHNQLASEFKISGNLAYCKTKYNDRVIKFARHDNE